MPEAKDKNETTIYLSLLGISLFHDINRFFFQEGINAQNCSIQNPVQSFPAVESIVRRDYHIVLFQ